MPLFHAASNVQINDGNFVDIGGDLNLHITQPTTGQDSDPLSAIESAFSGGGPGRRLLGVEDNRRQIGAARMLAYDPPLLNRSPFPFPRLEHRLGAPAILEPFSGTQNYVPIPQSTGYQHLVRGPTASSYLLPDSAPMSGPSHIPLINNHPSTSSALVLRQPVPTAQIFSDPALPSSDPPRIRLLAPTPRPPSVDHSGFRFFNHLESTNFEPFTGPPGESSQPFPAQYGSDVSLARIMNGRSWGSFSSGPKTNINVSGNVNNIQRQGESGLNILHRAVAGGAFHDSLERYPQPRCHPETRTEMLEDLRQWCSQTDFGSSVLWLHGPAGAGKSAIAQSVCQMMEAEGRLGASFFFKRGDASRGSGNKLFSTIAYQLALCLPDLQQIISQLVEDDPSILDRTLSTQLQRLIIEPYQHGIRSRPLVVVIDGLDECKDQSIQREILISLGRAINDQLLPFQLLIASRPEPHIQELFTGVLKDISRLLNIQQSFLDVHIYLKDELARVQREHWETMAMVPEPWPAPNILEKLTDKSSGYFVYAATVIRFIDDRDFRPTDRLNMIIGVQTVESEAPFAALDELYIQILSAVPVSRHPQLLEILAVIAAKFNLSGLHIEQLLEFQPGDARLILRHLHSVLDIPRDAGKRISVHHASFLDFLDDPTRSGVFHIGELQRTNLAHHILKGLSLEIDSSTDHVAWQLDQVEFEYVMSIQPTPDLVSRLRPLNTDFLVFPNVHHVIRKVLSWLRRCQPLPDEIIQLWEDYQAIVTSGIHSPSRMKIRSEGVIGELEMHRNFPQASAQLVKIMFTRVRRLLDSGDFSRIEATTADIHSKKENLADMDPSTIEDLASSMHYFGYWRGTAARTLIFNKEAVQVYRKLAETDPSINKDLALSLNNLGVDLRNTEQYEDAVLADEEAVQLHRKLAESNLGADLNNNRQYEAAVHAEEEAVQVCRKLVETDPTITKDLAHSLHNLGVDLSHTRQYEAAARIDEEAVQLRRKLAEIDPTVTKDLASSLHNLGIDLHKAGQYEAAVRIDEEAVQLRRKLAETDPTVSEDLASSLHNLGADLNYNRQYEAAVQAEEEAVQVRRKLVETNPTITKDLAHSLHNLGFDLRNTVQYEAAARIDEEAAQLRRKLAETDPTITKDLASSLHNLGIDLHKAGQYEAAARIDEEAVQLRRKLAETDPTVTKDLASSLHNLGIDLHKAGQYEAAARIDEEAVQLRRKLAETDPSISQDLATSLHNLGADLNNNRQYEAAVQAEEEAVQVRRKLVETNPTLTKDLAHSLHNLGVDLSHTRQYEAAVRADEEAVELRRKLVESNPTIIKDLAHSLQSLGFDLRAAGRHRDALSADGEAAEICRELAETDRTIILNLAHSLHSLSVNLGAVGRNEDASFAAEETVDLYSTQNQTVQTQLNLANVLVHWATYLRALNREEDSVQMCEKGVVIYRKLSETEPESTAGNLLLLARDLCVARLHEDALRAADQSIELYHGLTPAKLALTKDLIEALGCRAKSLRALGREEDAARAEAEIATLQSASSRPEKGQAPVDPSESQKVSEPREVA
ncbi:hypothetical protein DFH06DRAFT_1465829 [Mycena polygramma]|nr:hypothetical protein DFH06DRAFT_1465829 [Mycena polygramma]